MPRLFVFEKLAIGDEIVIAGEEAHHIIRVLRLGPGHSVSISDGKSVESLGVISDIDIRDTKIKIRILDQNKSKETKPFITLLQALPKGEKFDWIIQKSTEIGVSKIIPVITQRTIVNILPSKLERRMERWNKIAIEAAKQSLRMDIPQIGELSTFDASLREDREASIEYYPLGAGKGTINKKSIKEH
jgi:16S rRNA (uracil1498-N3)-methyltransferase